MLSFCAGGCPKKLLTKQGVHFRAGQNENLTIFEVVGKPGVDVSLVSGAEQAPASTAAVKHFRHANLAGAGKNCAAMAGDGPGP
jgi:hypothetical protein